MESFIPQPINNLENSDIKVLRFGDRKEINGVMCEYVDTGYTLRQYYAHSTIEKGPGPGWDTRTRLLDDAWAMERFGRTFSDKEVWALDSTQLPDVPFGKWVPIER
jgi:hypothetical protein